MVNYSKWDNIVDSDEEEAAQKPDPRQLQQAMEQHLRAPAHHEPKFGASGRECLEPLGMDQKLCIVPSMASALGGANQADLAKLAEELERRGEHPQAAEEQSKPGEPRRVCVVSDGRKKVHTTYADGSELVEEFDARSDVLLLRKRRRANVLGREAQWEYEVGQPAPAHFDPSSQMLQVSASNPIFLRKDTPECFQWRIRNLTYPENVYSIAVDHGSQQIVVRTSNKKYFKRIDVPDLRRVGLKLQDDLLSWKHQHNTLIISYARPAEVVAEELKTLKLVEKSAVKL